jgi:hypothetical protein
MATAVHATATLSPSSTSPSSITMQPRKFALAQVHDDVCLVQGESHSPVPSVPPSKSAPFLCLFSPHCIVCSSLAHESCHSALSAVEAQIYVHEFITIFRYSHPAVLHPSDIRILEWLDEQSVLDEADKGTVFLARDVMERLRRLTDRRWSIGASATKPPRSTYYSRGGRRMS